MWADAFLRDTQHLEVDEIGAYHLILYAMWRRPSCDFPDDDRRLAQVCRVSIRRWRSKIAPVLRPYFEAADGVLISPRLKREAAYVEEHVANQSRRRKSKKNAMTPARTAPVIRAEKDAQNSDKLLKVMDRGQSADASADHSADVSHPTTQQPTQREATDVPSLSFSPSLPDAKAREHEIDAAFEAFWQAYPHRGGAKKGKAPARRKWRAAVKSGVPPSVIIEAAKAHHADRRVVEGYARDPATWLNQRGWEDEIEPAAPTQGGEGHARSTGHSRAVASREVGLAAQRLAAARGSG